MPHKMLSVAKCLVFLGGALGAAFEHKHGALAAGGNIFSGSLTVADAEVKCSQLSNCAGFTFESPVQDPASVVWMRFKSEAHVNTDTAWQSYIKAVAPTPAPPVPPSPTPAVVPVASCAIPASYNIDASFYKKCVGLPGPMYIIGSALVVDAALTRAAELITIMIGDRQDIAS
jgi:hypothetical protein